MNKRLLTTKEAADQLRIAAQTLYNWRHRRKGPDYVMIGGAPRYEQEAIDRFKNQNRVRLSGNAA